MIPSTLSSVVVHPSSYLRNSKQPRFVSISPVNECLNVNVHVYRPDIPVSSADLTIYTPGILPSQLLFGYTPTQWGNYYHGMSGTLDEMGGAIEGWLSVTTAMGVYSLENSAFAHSAAAIPNHYNVAFTFHQVLYTNPWWLHIFSME